jgi:DNA-binding CsgD family transcriptional regulator
VEVVRRLIAAVEPAPEVSLIDRDAELTGFERAITRLSDGHGALVMVEAAAGLGKTVLLEHAAGMASSAGCLVRRASPGPSEWSFSYGVIRTLLDPPLRDAAPADRAELTAGAAARAGALLVDGLMPTGGDALLAHSILWLCAGLARRRPLVLTVDDAQWADRCSLEILGYLARRIDELPVLIAIGARPNPPGVGGDVLSLLGGAQGAVVLDPQPLSLTGAVRLIHRQAPDTPIRACCESHAATDGNPWLLGELARQIASHGPAVIDGADAAAIPVTAAGRAVVRRRLAELAPRYRQVASALAVIGDDVPPAVLAETAGVAVSELGAARDGLAAAGLLAADRMRFAHALIGVAIRKELSAAEHERLHRSAARALVDARAELAVAASHLLECAPHGEPWVSELLTGAARAAAGSGNPSTAAAYLERALAEGAHGDRRAEILVELATVQFDAGLPGSRRRLRSALRELPHGPRRTEVLTQIAGQAVLEGASAGLIELLDRELVQVGSEAERGAAEAAALDALMTVPDRDGERAGRVERLALCAGDDPLLTRVACAHRAWRAVEKGAAPAGAGAARALEAIDGGLLLEEVWRRSAYHLCVRALVLSDRIEDAARAIDALLGVAVARGSLRLRAGAAWYAAELELRSGRIVAAERRAREALELVPGDRNAFTGGAVEVLICALAERGEFARARELLRERELDGALGTRPWEIGVRHARARLWLAEGDFERAFAEASDAGASCELQGRSNPALTPWRSTAALALAHLGRRREAAALADAELMLAERFEAPVPIGRAMHARAVAEADDARRVSLSERALRLLDGAAAPVLERVRLRLELGTALSHMGRRIEARAALRPALADADVVGAVLLAERARRELVATGLRPRRAAIAGAAALTPRQRQICELAAAGKPNRAIAQQLFLSIKTVETHLAAGFRKLGVSTRTELASQLAG